MRRPDRGPGDAQDGISLEVGIPRQGRRFLPHGRLPKPAIGRPVG
jgi:hypothetical protein